MEGLKSVLSSLDGTSVFFIKAAIFAIAAYFAIKAGISWLRSALIILCVVAIYLCLP